MPMNRGAIASADAPAPGTVAIDLTPVLPGGENGGAKRFAVELVRRLAALHPRTRFLLLTQAASHDELGELERENVRRFCAVPLAGTSRAAGLLHASSRALAVLPEAAKRAAARAGHALHQRIKRSGARAFLRGEAPDVLFCPFTAPTYRRRGVPTVCTVYDLQFAAYPQFFTVEERTLRELAFRDACAHACTLAAISDFTRDTAIRHAGLDARRIETIPLRLARADVPRDDAVLERLALRAGRYLLYPANFWKHKNHETLLDAFAIARRDGLAEDIVLACTGAPGGRSRWLAEAARRMGLEPRVRFTGYLRDDELAALTAQCSALVFPSLYEGFGLPVTEAMAAGVPVACANTSALAETAADAALLFDPRTPTEVARALVAIVGDEELRRRLIQRGRERARGFQETDRMADDYWRLFVRACEPRR